MRHFPSRFCDVNRRLSSALENRLPLLFRQHLHTLYKYEVAELVNRRPGQVVVDIGGGKDCPFLPFVNYPDANLIISVDCSPDELHANSCVDNKVVADAAAPRLPFRDASVDLIVSRSVMEHLHDNAAFFENCARALRPGGTQIHTFSCKFAPFSLLNQLIPNRAARYLLSLFHPQWQADCGFPAFYNRCYFSATRRLLERNGFKDAQFTFRYYQAIYFNFFFPLYALMVGYDLLVWRLRIRNLAGGVLVRAERRGNITGCGPRSRAASSKPSQQGDDLASDLEEAVRKAIVSDLRCSHSRSIGGIAARSQAK